MKRPGLFWCLVAAFAGAALVSGMQALSWPLFGTWTTVRLVAVALPLSYIALLLALADAKVGRVILATMAVVVSLVGFFGPFEMSTLIAAELGMVWIVRSLSFHKSVLSAVVDGAVVAAGLAAALMAYASTRSIPSAAWTGLLVQAAFVYIPDRWGKPAGKAAAVELDSFQRAYQAADHALRDLAAR